MQNKYWYLYIAKAKTGRYYTGISQNPSKRLIRHNNGSGSKFAKDQGPFTLAYISPAINSYKEAIYYEIKIKDWSQIKKNKLISGEWKLF